MFTINCNSDYLGAWHVRWHSADGTASFVAFRSDHRHDPFFQLHDCISFAKDAEKAETEILGDQT